MLNFIRLPFLFFVLLLPISLLAQKKGTPKEQSQPATSKLADSIFTEIKLRNIGPAFMSGRIADVAIDPNDENIWFAAVGSGGVWKTVNAGVTWIPLFDKQNSYSIGCVTIDPGNSNVIWVGTGENVGGRHVGFGDGIYRSDDGGLSWQNKGLKTSEHISKIIVHPTNGNIVWVAAQGPLWSKGGERGFYKSIDGGTTWKQTLGDSMWVGVTDIMLDPRNPDLIYAATWQRTRNVANFIGGGPGTGLYRSYDGGDTWTELKKGLPTTSLGKIGLAISPQFPDVIYAAIEEERISGGVYRSTDRGSSWTKMSNTISGATGPHYYQELYASPHQFDRIYLMDNVMQVSDDGGRSFRRVNTEHKHVDNHAMAFKKDDPDYLLVGTDGGLYESFDLAKNWRFMANLPVTQFYKIALDDRRPFYNIYGGTQDNSTLGGPSRTNNMHGIQNSDWTVILDWDGHQTATEPGNPDIVYAERQEGQLSRIDMSIGDVVDIQPQPDAAEPYERFNWDAPILVSPHKPSRLYFASQRIWKSDNRGDQWVAISGDLTRNQDRFTLPIMGKIQSWDESWDVNAMSNYNTITSLAESPIVEGLLYAGTDDGIIQVTEDGGSSWRKFEVGSISGMPATAFVNDIKADLFDANIVYAALDNHKFGDFTPYLIKSTDRGRTWQSLRSNLPDRTLVWRLVQDHVDKNLLFIGTEFGLYFTVDGGTEWVQVKGGCPTIPFRDLVIQRHENDLVGASFGRGIFILDDYSFLRSVSDKSLDEEAHLYETRNAHWYLPRSQIGFNEEKGSLGSSHFVAPNPPFGAVFTYYLKDDLKSKSAIRKEKEKQVRQTEEDIVFPGWEELEKEANEDMTRIWLTITDEKNTVVRRIGGSVTKGFHRITWDLKYPGTEPLRLEDKRKEQEFNQSGFMAAPGKYTATLSRQIAGEVTVLSEPISFDVVPMQKGVLQGSTPQETASFWRTYEQAAQSFSIIQLSLQRSNSKIEALQKAVKMSTTSPGDLDKRVFNLRAEMIRLNESFSGLSSRKSVGEKNNPTVEERLFKVLLGINNSIYGPTKTNLKTIEIINDDLVVSYAQLKQIIQDLNALASDLYEAGGPWIEGEALPLVSFD